VNKPAFWRMACALLVICAATAIASSAQTLTTLALFDEFDGSGPYTAPLVQGADGNFYGTTTYGGANCVSGGGCGTVFKITPEGTLTTVYSFCAQSGCTDGIYPYAGLVQGTDGNFYGTTTQGGASGHDGTVFKITPAGTLTTLYSFCAQVNCADGGYPFGGLVQASDGNFYGTTFSGGVGDAQYCNGGCGTVFKITPKGALKTLHSFEGYDIEGSGPSAALVQGGNGNFYGTTTNGGAYNACALGCGTVFEITSKGALKTLHSFAGYPSDGAAPYASLVRGADGTFYGTTANGGAGDDGTIFEVTAAGVATTYSFCTQANCTDGGDPEGGLVRATDGSFYGTAIRGGVYGAGSIFKITTVGQLTTLYTFCAQGYPDCPDGSFVYAGLLQATNGSFYGTTNSGGDLTCNFIYGCGTVFSLNTGLGPFVTFVRSSAKAGQSFGIIGQGFTGTTTVLLDGTSVPFTVKSDALIVATVTTGASSGYVTVSTPGGTLRSNAPFNVIP
jgi:uncharacterized repeat protein (TIGR03803 family)